MTLIVGALCDNGIVIGSDGARSISGLVHPAEKLHVLRDDWVVGLAGNVGVNQQNLETFKTLYTKSTDTENLKKLRNRIGTSIRDSIHSVLGVDSNKLVTGTPLPPDLQNSALVALPSKEGIYLIQFDFRGTSTLASASPPFFAIGSGNLLAYSAFAFLNVHWANGLPPISIGLFTTMYTLIHSIDIGATLGLSEPIQIATLQYGKNDKPIARILEDSELVEHRHDVKNFKKYVHEYNLRNVNDLPQPPQPPSQPTA